MEVRVNACDHAAVLCHVAKLHMEAEHEESLVSCHRIRPSTDLNHCSVLNGLHRFIRKTPNSLLRGFSVLHMLWIVLFTDGLTQSLSRWEGFTLFCINCTKIPNYLSLILRLLKAFQVLRYKYPLEPELILLVYQLMLIAYPPGITSRLWHKKVFFFVIGIIPLLVLGSLQL